MDVDVDVDVDVSVGADVAAEVHAAVFVTGYVFEDAALDLMGWSDMPDFRTLDMQPPMLCRLRLAAKN